LRKSLLVFLGCACLALAQQAPPPDCKPITYFGVTGCELSAQGECPKGYHKQGVCPPDPKMKAPCRLMCVPDTAPKTKGKPDAEPQKP
jgi:hypothetical protein